MSGTQFANAYDTMPSKRASTRKLHFFDWPAIMIGLGDDISISLSLCIVHFLKLRGGGMGD